MNRIIYLQDFWPMQTGYSYIDVKSRAQLGLNCIGYWFSLLTIFSYFFLKIDSCSDFIFAQNNDLSKKAKVQNDNDKWERILSSREFLMYWCQNILCQDFYFITRNWNSPMQSIGIQGWWNRCGLGARATPLFGEINK